MKTLKSSVRSTAPGLYGWLQNRFGHPARYGRAARVVERLTNGIVAAGPFQGTRLANMVTGSFVPKLIGSYERELQGVISDVIARPPPCVVDVGCGEGYYLIGLARVLPGILAIGYDINEAARSACLENAALNSVSDRVQVNGECDHATLNRLNLDQALLIVDCEGFERELLDPGKVSQLKQCSVLVEIHERFVPGVTRELLNRFSPTHDIELIDSEPRDPRKYHFLNGLSARRARMVVNESRGGPMQWGWMMPKADAR